MSVAIILPEISHLQNCNVVKISKGAMTPEKSNIVCLILPGAQSALKTSLKPLAYIFVEVLHIQNFILII